MNTDRVRTQIIIPKDTIFDFVGNGLVGDHGQLVVDAGAGMTFNEWGRLILNLGQNGGLGYINDALCINACEVSSAVCGQGLKVQNCQLAVDFSQVAGCGIVVTPDNLVNVDLASLAGAGLTAIDCSLTVDPAWVAQAAQAQINNNAQVDPTQTTIMPYTISTEFRYKPNGYGYNSGLEIVSTSSTMTVYRNANGCVVGVAQGAIVITTQDFDFSAGVEQKVSERPCTPVAPNFYAK